MPQPSANSDPNHSGGPAVKSGKLLTAGAWLAAASLAGIVWLLSGMWISRGSDAGAGQHNAVALVPFWILSAACWVGLTMVWLALRRGESAFRTRDRRATIIVLGVAMCARAIVLATHDPALSDDVYRYVFDGRNLAHGFNPYLTEPEDRIAALTGGAAEHWKGEREILALLAYPEITTPYLPVSHFVFGGMGLVCEWGGWTAPRESARVFRIGFTLFEIGMILLLGRVLRRRGLTEWWLALYAWHPLAIEAVAASGHQDVIGIWLMVMALAFFELAPIRRERSVAPNTTSPPPTRARQSVGPSLAVAMWGSLVAMACMVKPIAIFAGICVLRTLPIRAWLIAGVMMAVGGIAASQILDWYPNRPAFVAWKQTADWMAEKAAHFGGVYEPVLCIVRHAMPDGPDRQPGFNLEQEWLARKICMWSLAFAVVMILIFVRDAWRATAAAMFAIALCSTTCHPWYLLWGLALFPIAAGGRALWVFSLTISFGYIVFINGKGHAFSVEWTTQPWMLALAYIPVGFALLVDIASIRRRNATIAATL